MRWHGRGPLGDANGAWTVAARSNAQHQLPLKYLGARRSRPKRPRRGRGVAATRQRTIRVAAAASPRRVRDRSARRTRSALTQSSGEAATCASVTRSLIAPRVAPSTNAFTCAREIGAFSPVKTTRVGASPRKIHVPGRSVAFRSHYPRGSPRRRRDAARTIPPRGVAFGAPARTIPPRGAPARTIPPAAPLGRSHPSVPPRRPPPPTR